MKRQICIIDDDEDVRGVMAFALDFEGMSSLTFESCRQAEEYLSRLSADELPCLMIIDYMMPEMNGLEFISLLARKYPATLNKIPMVLSTARLSDEVDNLPGHIMRLEKPLDLQNFLDLARQHYQKPEEIFLSSAFQTARHQPDRLIKRLVP
jgi:CheY-like chemotaxis protein